MSLGVSLSLLSLLCTLLLFSTYFVNVVISNFISVPCCCPVLHCCTIALQCCCAVAGVVGGGASLNMFCEGEGLKCGPSRPPESPDTSAHGWHGGPVGGVRKHWKMFTGHWELRMGSIEQGVKIHLRMTSRGVIHRQIHCDSNSTSS